MTAAHRLRLLRYLVRVRRAWRAGEWLVEEAVEVSWSRPLMAFLRVYGLGRVPTWLLMALLTAPSPGCVPRQLVAYLAIRAGDRGQRPHVSD